MGKAFSLISPETGFIVKEEVKIILLAFLFGNLLSLFFCIKYFVLGLFKKKGKSLIFYDIMSTLEMSLLVFLFSLKYTFGEIRLYIVVFLVLGYAFWKKQVMPFLKRLIFLMFKPFVSKYKSRL